MGINWQSDENSKWVTDLEAVKPEFTTIKVWCLLQFYRLIGKRTVLIKDNLEPIPDLYYLLFSPQESRYYLKQFRGYSVDELYYYRRTLTFSGEDEAIVNLRHFVSDGNIFLLLTEIRINEMKEMLDRVYRANMQGVGSLKYKTFIRLLEFSLMKEDYTEYYSGGLGYKTAMNKFEQDIQALWQSCLKN